MGNEVLDDILDKAKEASVQLSDALSEAAFRLGCVTMKLAIGKALRDAGLYEEATMALALPTLDFKVEVAKFESALERVTKGTIQ